MSKLIDLVGVKFSRLTVISRGVSSTRGDARWDCRCECGNTKLVAGNHLRNKAIVSCGCYREDAKKTHGRHRSATYTAWGNMVQRCSNPNNGGYKDYGGRGIAVCDRWYSFENFYSDMGDAEYSLTLERVDNDLGYCKDNCKWATPTEQALNKRLRKDNSSGYRGVYPNKKRGGWDVQLFRNGRSRHIGHFVELHDAILARKHAEEDHGKV